MIHCHFNIPVCGRTPYPPPNKATCKQEMHRMGKCMFKGHRGNVTRRRFQDKGQNLVQALSPGETNIKFLGFRNDRILAGKLGHLAPNLTLPDRCSGVLLFTVLFCDGGPTAARRFAFSPNNQTSNQ